MLDDLQKNFDAGDIQYYFESQQHDTHDLQGRSRRASEVLKLRDRLLSMPEKEFDTAIHAIRAILDPKTGKDAEDQKAKKRDAAELYERARTEQVSPIKMGSL
ncbi:MAG: hypothetical protein V4655_04140 [Bdellovibrionota bacterium]|nr:MAG: hypothetical protein EOP10_11300 [Pseudomonadota bacterium]